MARVVHALSPQAERLRPREVVEILARSVMMEMDFRLEAAGDVRTGSEEHPRRRRGFPRAEARLVTDRPRRAGERVDRGHPASTTARRSSPPARSEGAGALGDPVLPAPRHPPGRLLPRRHASGKPVRRSGRHLVAVDFGIMGRLGHPERRFLAEILLGFILRDYRRVAQVHFEAGYVPGAPLGGGFRAGHPGDRRADPPAQGQRDLDGQGADPALRYHGFVRHEHPHRTRDAPEDHGGGGRCGPLPRPQLDMWTGGEPVVRSWITQTSGRGGRIEGVGRARSPSPT